MIESDLPAFTLLSRLATDSVLKARCVVNDMERAYQVLKETFGFEDFKLSQKEVIHRLIVENENALVLFPTGGLWSLPG